MALILALIWLLILAVLLTCFAVAAIVEFRSGTRTAGLAFRMVEIVAGVVASLALPSKFWGTTGLSSARLSWTMVWACLLLCGLALVSKYASRGAMWLVFVGYGALTFLWYFNGAYHDVTDDRTAYIHWQYEWDTEDPVARITEKFRPGSVSKHGSIFSPPAISANGSIYLLRPHDYTEPRGLSLAAFNPGWLWELRPSGGICTSPAIADDGTILFGTEAENSASPRTIYTGQGPAWAVSLEGEKKWVYEFPPVSFFHARDYGGGAVFPAKSPACSQPAIAADGTSYWIGHGVYALTSDGALRWAFEPDEDFYFVCVAEDGTVYALADGVLFALAPDGAQKWNYSFSKSKYFAGGLAIGPDRTIYLAEDEPGLSSSLFALTPQGALKWRNDSYQLHGGPLVAPNGTIFQQTEGRINNTVVVALDASGKTKWDTPNGSNPLAVASDGTLYICYVRDLFAISPRGNMLWKAQLPENPDILDAHLPTKAVTLASNGTFYIGDFLGRLGTFDAPTGLATSGWPAPFHDARNTSRAGAR